MTQREALAILKTGANVFLTGGPGSGKTHTINTFCAWLREQGIEPSITASTGIAATHVGGMTIHAWSGIGVHRELSPADIDRIASKESVAKRIMHARVLIIEEISMLSASTLDMVDAVCREVRRSEKPFGGLTVVLVGDFFQLPPVSRESETPFAYRADAWRNASFITCYLTEQHRHEEVQLLELLTAVRDNRTGAMHAELLESRSITPSDAGALAVPKLYSHNEDVDAINAEELAKLPGKSATFLMGHDGPEALTEALVRGCLSPEMLELKIGASVMFTKNSPLGLYVNGTLGTVQGWDGAGYPRVRLPSGQTITAEPVEWKIEEDGKVRASITQVPLRLAYALTVHKSQGMTMDSAVIDLSRAFEYGQGYVALSRVRRLSGIYLLGVNAQALRVHPRILAQDVHFREASIVAEHAFAELGEREVIEMQKRFVLAMRGVWKEGAPTPAKPKARRSPARSRQVRSRVSSRQMSRK